MKGKFMEMSFPMVMIAYGENHVRGVYPCMYLQLTLEVMETQGIYVWADITYAADDIRLQPLVDFG